MTTTVIVPAGDELARVQSTHPQVHPVGGRKRLDPSQPSPIGSVNVLASGGAFDQGSVERAIVLTAQAVPAVADARAAALPELAG